MRFRRALVLASLTACGFSDPPPGMIADDAATEKTPPPKPDAGLGGPEKLS